MTYTNVEYTAADIYGIKYKRKLDHFRNVCWYFQYTREYIKYC